MALLCSNWNILQLKLQAPVQCYSNLSGTKGLCVIKTSLDCTLSSIKVIRSLNNPWAFKHICDIAGIWTLLRCPKTGGEYFHLWAAGSVLRGGPKSNPIQATQFSWGRNSLNKPTNFSNATIRRNKPGETLIKKEGWKALLHCHFYHSFINEPI